MNLFEQRTIVPVVVINDAAQAVPLAQAIARAGGQAIEITLRTAAGLDAIRAIAQSDVEIVVGAGTVITPQAVEQAHEAGARFLVSPGLDPELVAASRNCGNHMIPGILTPSEAQQAMALGLNMVKFFPAELGGGAKMLRTFASVYSQLRFMPTGGIGMHNIHEYATLDSVVAIGGSWMCPSAALETGDMAQVETLMRDALSALA